MVTIRITSDQLYEILTMSWNTEKEVEIWNHIEKNGFIFNEYRLTIRGKYFDKEVNIVYKVKIEGYEEKQKIYIREVMIDESGKRDIYEHETTVDKFLDGLQKSLEYELKRINNKNRKGAKQIFDADHILAPMYFMRYCVNRAMEQEVVEIEKTKRKYKPINERKEYKPKTEYKLFELIRKYQKHINNNRHNITCDYWEVKGHFRHYKNGKVVYVKPFAKGKNKENHKEINKTYTL